MLLLSADFFQNELFQKILSETLSENQTRHFMGPDLDQMFEKVISRWQNVAASKESVET